MPKIVLDAAMSLDGISFDDSDRSLFPIEEMHEAGLVDELAARTGAVIMNQRSFAGEEDPDWYADSYEFQAPIFVITDNPPTRMPKSNERLSFSFVSDMRTALAAAREAAGGGDVMLIGEPSLAQAALKANVVDEFYLRIVPRIVGQGKPLFETHAPVEFRRASVRVSATATHIHLIRSTG